MGDGTGVIQPQEVLYAKARGARGSMADLRKG